MHQIMSIFAEAEQHALGSGSSAAGMLVEARATLALHPECAVLTADIKNAFGSVLRSAILSAVMQF